MKDEQGTVIMCMKYEKSGSWKDLEKNSLYPTLKTKCENISLSEQKEGESYQERNRWEDWFCFNIWTDTSFGV